jgi:hypothetical protein
VDLTWIVVAIGGCVGLAVCILAVLFRPVDTKHRPLRPLANVGRLTNLPEYIRAARLRTVTAVVTMALLLVIFVGSILAASRPTGLFTSATQSGGGDPEDIMLCVGEPATEPAASAALRYFGDRVSGFDTQRIGLTSANRRVVPLTRDYQYAKAQFFAYAADQQGDNVKFAPSVSYSDYAESVEDLLALCLAGFPAFDENAAQRRSLIYVGPDTLREPGDPRPSLFTADRVREMVTAANVQMNVLVTGNGPGALATLAADTGGRSFSGNSDVTTRMAEIRANPPAPRISEEAVTRAESTDTPDIPIIVALLAATVLAVWPVVRRT